MMIGLGLGKQDGTHESFFDHQKMDSAIHIVQGEQNKHFALPIRW